MQKMAEVLITMNDCGLTVTTATIWPKEHGHAHIGMDISIDAYLFG